jgi:hypothetical protein
MERRQRRKRRSRRKVTTKPLLLLCHWLSQLKYGLHLGVFPKVKV